MEVIVKIKWVNASKTTMCMLKESFAINWKIICHISICPAPSVNIDIQENCWNLIELISESSHKVRQNNFQVDMKTYNIYDFGFETVKGFN